ncbi:MAG: hypothetical protein GWO20_08000 [Candidatus Korarchaeota archaeon]|nr:hypothetical protein [Candidatus Korarchaeota archaeon]
MKTYPYNPDTDTPIFDQAGNRLYSIPTTRNKHIFNADGERLSKITLKIPQKRGFGNEEFAKKINRGGRPKGSKSKNTLKDAIKKFESNQLEAAQLIVAVMMGDEEAVGGEIKVSDRIGAAKYVIEAPKKMNSNDKTNNKVTEAKEESKEPKEEEPQPLIALTVPTEGS